MTGPAISGLVTSNPLEDWGVGLLLLGGIVLLLSVAFGIGEFVIAQAGDRNYGFAALAGRGLVAATVLMVFGGILYALTALPRPQVRSPTFEADVTDPNYRE